MSAQVMRAAKPLLLLCHSDKACLPGNSFVRELEGVGALVGKTHLEVCPAVCLASCDTTTTEM